MSPHFFAVDSSLLSNKFCCASIPTNTGPPPQSIILHSNNKWLAHWRSHKGYVYLTIHWLRSGHFNHGQLVILIPLLLALSYKYQGSSEVAITIVFLGVSHWFDSTRFRTRMFEYKGLPKWEGGRSTHSAIPVLFDLTLLLLQNYFLAICCPASKRLLFMNGCLHAMFVFCVQTIGKYMGLDVQRPASLWKDRALIEVNVAVLHSFQVNSSSETIHNVWATSYISHGSHLTTLYWICSGLHWPLRQAAA